MVFIIYLFIAPVIVGLAKAFLQGKPRDRYSTDIDLFMTAVIVGAFWPISIPGIFLGRFGIFLGSKFWPEVKK